MYALRGNLFAVLIKVIKSYKLLKVVIYFILFIYLLLFLFFFIRKRGSLLVSALTSGARRHGFDTRGRRGKLSVSEHAFLSIICRDDTK